MSDFSDISYLYILSNDVDIKLFQISKYLNSISLNFFISNLFLLQAFCNYLIEQLSHKKFSSVWEHQSFTILAILLIPLLPILEFVLTEHVDNNSLLIDKEIILGLIFGGLIFIITLLNIRINIKLNRLIKNNQFSRNIVMNQGKLIYFQDLNLWLIISLSILSASYITYNIVYRLNLITDNKLLNSSKSKRQISEPIDTTKDFDSTVIALGTPKHYAESTIRSKQIIVEMRQDVIVDAREFDDNDGARTPFRPFSPASHSLSSSSLNNYPNKSLKNNRQQNNNGKNNNDDNITIATATTPRSSNYSNATTPRSSNYSNTATRLSNYNNNDYGVRLGGGKFNHTIHGSSGLSQEHSIIKEESEYNNCNDTSSSIYSSDIRIGSNLQSTVGDNKQPIQPTYQEQPIQSIYQEQPIQQIYQEQPVFYQEEQNYQVAQVYQEQSIQPIYQEQPIQPTYQEQPIQSIYQEQPIQQIYQEQPVLTYQDQENQSYQLQQPQIYHHQIYYEEHNNNSAPQLNPHTNNNDDNNALYQYQRSSF
ncbi:9371_t:CDS:2 [Entrophospora sp. SA101]|nr:9371_t:CDS:2 [Entrophospora sp. SA101]